MRDRTQYNKEYRKKNKAKLDAYGKAYAKRNKGRRNEYHREYQRQESEKAKAKIRQKKYREENREKINAYFRKYRAERRAIDPVFRLMCSMRSRVHHALNSQWAMKLDTSMRLFGCGVDEMKAHLESQFTEGMTWENYGLHGWHVDHIKPCASFDLTLDSEQKACFHYTNLQPLWAEDNLRKSNKYANLTKTDK